MVTRSHWVLHLIYVNLFGNVVLCGSVWLFLAIPFSRAFLRVSPELNDTAEGLADFSSDSEDEVVPSPLLRSRGPPKKTLPAKKAQKNQGAYLDKVE